MLGLVKSRLTKEKKSFYFRLLWTYFSATVSVKGNTAFLQLCKVTIQEDYESGKNKLFSYRSYSGDVIIFNCVRCTQSRSLHRGNRCAYTVNGM